MNWKSPVDGACCECRPTVCDPCDGCPVSPSVEVALSGVAPCCAASNVRLAGLGAVNGVHLLARRESGDYETTLAAAVEFEWFLEPDCTGYDETTGPYDVTVAFSCNASTATLDVRLTASGTRLFHAQIDTPAPGALFVFEGPPECGGLQPYTFGGAATVELPGNG